MQLDLGANSPEQNATLLVALQKAGNNEDVSISEAHELTMLASNLEAAIAEN
jgi:hypothetical protein